MTSTVDLSQGGPVPGTPGPPGPPDQASSTERRFTSILNAEVDPGDLREEHPTPSLFKDLSLEHLIRVLIPPGDLFDLTSYFYRPLTSEVEVTRRQRVFQALEDQWVRAAIDRFCGHLDNMHTYLTGVRQAHYSGLRQRWFLNATLHYCAGVRGLAADLGELDLQSEALAAARSHVVDLSHTAAFDALHQESTAILADLSQVRYSLLNREERLTVAPCDEEVDYSRIVLDDFARFAPAAVEPQAGTRPSVGGMNHVENQILEMVMRLRPALFQQLGQFVAAHEGFAEQTVLRMNRELRFYLAYLDFIHPLRTAGHEFCYPSVSATTTEESATDTFDLDLAARLLDEQRTLITNSFSLSGAERLIVVSGPNQGGKTTLARTYGQLHYLASLGCPVPGRDLALRLPDRIETHFEREENLEDLSGKLEDELQRVHHILERTTDRTVIVLNEMFGSTTVRDAEVLSRAILAELLARGAIGLCVTFLDDLSRLDERTVSMVSTVREDDPAVRTFLVVRRRADGRAFAHALAHKHGLTFEQLQRRLS